MRGLPAVLIAVALLPVLAMPTAVGSHECPLVAPGQLFVPTLTKTPWPFVTQSLNGIVVHRLESFAIGAYWLYADVQPHVIAGTHWPDFNIAFYDEDDDYMGHNSMPGNEQGVVPPGTATAIIYMTTGPDPGISDGKIGAAFKFYQGCGTNGPHL